MPDSSLIPPCVAAKVVLNGWGLCADGVSLPHGRVLNEWLTEEGGLWLQSRIQLRALSYYSGWLQYFSAYYTGRFVLAGSYGMAITYRCYADIRPRFDDAGRRMIIS